MKQLIILITLLVMVPEVHAADGRELLNDCQELVNQLDIGHTPKSADGYFDAGNCIGFVRGVRSTMQVLLSGEENPFLKMCWPKNGTDGQSVRIIVKYLKANPEKLHEDQTSLAMIALGLAFPCKM